MEAARTRPADYMEHKTGDKTGVKATLGADYVRLEAAGGADLDRAVGMCHACIEAACEEAFEWQGNAATHSESSGNDAANDEV